MAPAAGGRPHVEAARNPGIKAWIAAWRLDTICPLHYYLRSRFDARRCGPGSNGGRVRTYSAKPGEVQRNWWVVDADGKNLGRLASEIADVLRGKNKPQYTPHVDTGDFVVVVNAEKIAVTGKKLTDKLYRRHSGYPGGLRTRSLGQMLEQRPTEVLRKAVKGMMPKNRLAAQQLGKLKIYAGPKHPHAAQKPEELPWQQ